VFPPLLKFVVMRLPFTPSPTRFRPTSRTTIVRKLQPTTTALKGFRGRLRAY